MLQAPIRSDVYTPQITAVFGTRQVDVTRVNVSREMSDSLPGSGRFTAATGMAQVADGPDVAESVVTPWDPASQWPPAPESTASVHFDIGGGPVPALAEGRVVSVRGGSGAREVEVDVADRYEALNRTVSWDPLLANMPALDSRTQFRHVGLQSAWVTDRILRHCGFYATPPKAAGAFMSATFMGSAWPEQGTVTQCGRYSDPALYPSWPHTPWGVCARDIKALYEPSRSVVFSDNGAEVTAMLPPPNVAESMFVKVLINGRELVTQWTQNAIVLTAQTGPDAYTELARIPRGDARTFAARFVRPTSGRVQGEIRLDTGATVSGSSIPMSDVYLTAVIDEVQVLGKGDVGAVQVASSSTPYSVVDYVPSAVLYTRSGGRNSLTALPTAESEDCASLLAQQCAAEAATFWIDETGVLRWWDLARLEQRGSVTTLTSGDHISDAGFAWSHDRSAVKSRAAVRWSQPAVDRSYNARVDLWQGRGMTIASGDTVEEWAACPDDEVWIMPDLALKMGDGGSDDFNYGVGSFVAACLGDSDTAAQSAGSFSAGLRLVTGSAAKLTYNWVGPDVAILQTPSERKTSPMWMRRRNMNMPILRGKARVKFVDTVTYSTQSGPVSAPEHVIDAGWWIQSDSQAQYTADYAGARVSTPQPVLSSVSVIPVPGVQLGDVLTIRDDDATHLMVKGLVIGVDAEYGVDGVSQSVMVRPVEVSKTGVTWEAWANYIAGDEWIDFADSQQGRQWQEWGSDPLDEGVA